MEASMSRILSYTTKIIMVFQYFQNANHFKLYNSLNKDLNWAYIRRSEDVLDVFQTPYVRLTYVLCPGETGF